jgi:predicted  nucleic acid-binding Zn-ribbon protein
MKKYEELKHLITALESDIVKFGNGNNAAGTRVRKGLQAIKNTAQQLRVEIQEVKNTDK